MLARLRIKLESGEDELSYLMGSSFHGAMMKMLTPSYAEELHQSRLHPYTQHLEERDGEWYWIINALNAETAERLLRDSVMKQSELQLDKHRLTVGLAEMDYQELPYTALDQYYYNEEPDKYISLSFITPAAFKQNGAYINYPDIRMIYAGLIKRYAAARGEDAPDGDLADKLAGCTSVSRYMLRSTLFSLEGVRIPAFLGSMTLKLNGTQSLCNLAHLLALFGSYSGIGIKTSLGMGAISIGS